MPDVSGTTSPRERGLLQRIHWFGHGAAADAAGVPAPPFRLEDFSPALKTRLLILQPTPFCNIDCSYCYLPNRRSTARMTMRTVRLAARRLVDDGLLGPALTVVWHAGEPMVLPSSWYEEAVSAVHEELGAHTGVTHSIQTNATLIDVHWCDFIRREGIRVGVSVDGPAVLHDRHRRTRSGKGTHAKVMHGIAMMRDAGIPFHAIAVVTRNTLQQADEFFDFFQTVGATELGCNFDEAEGVNLTSSLAGYEQVHAEFLLRALERYKRCERPLLVRELTMAARLVMEPLPEYSWRSYRWPDNAQVLPWALISVSHDGRFSTFSPELLGQSAGQYSDFVFGDVSSGGYMQAMHEPAFLRTWQAVVRGVMACERGCAYFGYCGGGSPVNKFYELGGLDGSETLYCRTMVQRPFATMLAEAERASAGGMGADVPCPAEVRHGESGASEW